MNTTQQQALERGRKNFGIKVARGLLETSIAPDASFDLDHEFGRKVDDLIVEIGCGVGDSLAAMATNRKDANILAFEVYARGVARTFLALEKHQLSNVRLIEADGVQGLETLIKPGQLAELWTFFPDPWQKKRHHKRRLISKDFAELVATRLRDGGIWRIATDWDDYAIQISEVLGALDEFKYLGDGRADRPITQFERRGIEASRQITDFVYQKHSSTPVNKQGVTDASQA